MTILLTIVILLLECVSAHEKLRTVDLANTLSISHRRRTSSQKSMLSKALKEWIFQISGRLGASFDINKPTPAFVSEPPPNLLTCMNQTDGPTNILILGDSVNRMMIEEWCASRGATLISWGPQFHYSSKKAATPAATCQVGSTRIAFLHMYGSAKEGPYFNNNYATSEDPFVDTQLRIPEAINCYSDHFGIPNFVIFRTELWDLQPITVDLRYIGVTKRFNESWYVDHSEEVMGRFISDQVFDINLIRSLLPNSYIGSHTVPTIKWGLHLFHHFTNSMRYISSVTDSFLLDFNLMLLQSIEMKDAYLRDYHHPNEAYTIRFAEILVRALQAWSTCSVERDDPSLVQGLVRLRNGTAFYVSYGVRRPITSEANFEFYRKVLPLVSDSVENHAGAVQDMESLVESMRQGAPMSAIFREDSLVLPPGTKQVYWLSDGKRRPVSGVKVFYAHGWDFSDVQSLSVDTDFEYSLVPLGAEI